MFPDNSKSLFYVHWTVLYSCVRRIRTENDDYFVHETETPSHYIIYYTISIILYIAVVMFTFFFF